MSLEANVSDALHGREQLQRAFQKSSRAILLYIDNVEQPQHFQDLLPKVEHLPKGSRLLVTTRNEKISACLGELGVKADRCSSISVNTLKTEESRGLLRKWALRKIENKEIIDKNEALKELEDEVLSKCNGLPLALKLMGSYIAQSKKGAENVETWRHVVKSMKEGRPIDGDKNNELYARLRVSIEVLDEGLRQDLFDMVACNYFQHWYSRWAFESIFGEEGMQNLMDRHILEDEGQDNVGCHDVIQSLVKHMARTSNELHVTGKGLEQLQDDGAELARIVCLEGAVIRDVRLLNRMKKLRFVVNVRVEMDEPPSLPASSLVEIHLPHIKVLELLKMDDGIAYYHDGPLLKLGRCPDLRLLASCGDVFAWQESNARFFAEKLAYLRIEKCNQLQEADVRCLPWTTPLSSLVLIRCNSLATFPPRDTTTAAAATRDLFISLKSLHIEDCQNLGEIPETIHRLAQLTYLKASGCMNLRHLPNGIGQLTSLQKLWINDYPRLQEIPETIGTLSYLTLLSVSGCRNLPRLPDGIGRLSSLQSLDIVKCENLVDIPETICRLSHLTCLNAEGCSNLRHLPNEIGQLTNLQWLWLKECPRLMDIPETIRRLSQLSYLSVSGCTNLSRLPNGIGHLSNLRFLHVGKCENLVDIPETIRRLSQLSYLSVSGCTNLSRLPNGIGHLSNLQRLYINDCRSIGEIPETIHRLSQLTYLNASDCTNLKQLPNEIGQLTSLRVLEVNGCSRLRRLPDGMLENLAGSLSGLFLRSCWRLQTLPAGISLCTSLRILVLRYCASLQCIPIGVGQLTNLETLDLKGCTSLPRLPDGVFQNLAGSLSKLRLWNCRRLETLPEGMSLLRGLKFLILGNCQSVRCIPEGKIQQVLPESEALSLRGYAGLQKLPSGMFDNLGRSLTMLDLSNFERMETLPQGISLLTSLTVLRLNGCRSLQCIPDGIQELASLQNLDLRGCTRIRKLPHDMFMNLIDSLSRLNLSFCERLEMIPQGISGLTSLIELRFEQCESLQRIPEGIMELPNLQTLDLRGCTGLLQEGLPNGALTFQALAGSLLKRERKMSKKKNLLRHLLYMVSL